MPTTSWRGHHDVVHGDVFKVEDRQQHRLVATRNHGAGFVDHGAQLISGQMVTVAGQALDANQAQQAVGDRIDQPYQRVEHLEQRLQRHGCRVGDTLGLDGRIGLGADLGEYQDHDGQDQRGNGRAGDLAEKVNGQHRGQGRRQVIDQIIADQDHADQPVGPGQ